MTELVRCPDLTSAPRGWLQCQLSAGHEVDQRSLHLVNPAGLVLPDATWALDIADGWPVLAHLIVDPPVLRNDVPWPDHVTAACGRVFRPGDLHTGFWPWRPGAYPMADHAIHCGRRSS